MQKKVDSRVSGLEININNRIIMETKFYIENKHTAESN